MDRSPDDAAELFALVSSGMPPGSHTGRSLLVRWQEAGYVWWAPRMRASKGRRNSLMVNVINPVIGACGRVLFIGDARDYKDAFVSGLRTTMPSTVRDATTSVELANDPKSFTPPLDWLAGQWEQARPHGVGRRF